MINLSRNQVQEIVKELENSIIRPECLTCDCFQGLLTQLELDCSEDICNLITPLKAPPGKMHGCLGCNPCPPGALFAQYIKSKTNDSNKVNIKESISMETEKKKKGFMATIWESMTKTGGCCGGGDCGCGPSNDDDSKTSKEKNSCDDKKRK
jgi:hypothetical protein